MVLLIIEQRQTLVDFPEPQLAITLYKECFSLILMEDYPINQILSNLSTDSRQWEKHAYVTLFSLAIC